MLLNPYMLTVLWDTSAQTFARNLPGDWLAIMLTVVMIIALALTILYMVSRIFMVQTLESTIKREMFQLGATLILIFFLFTFEQTQRFLIAGSQDIRDMISEKAAEQLLGKSGYSVNIFDVSYVYLIALTKCQKIEFSKALSSQTSEILTRISFGFDIFGGYIPVPLALIFKDLVWEPLIRNMLISEEIMWLSIATYFQINLLQWIEASMVTVYLPLGVLLRAIPFTRGGGAAIMAVAISLYFVYPFLLTVLFFNGPPLPSECKVTIGEVPPQPQRNTPAKKLCPADPTAVEELISQGGLSGGGEGESSSGGFGLSGSAGFSGDTLGKIKLYSYFYPFIAMVGTLLFARSLAQVLGGNIADIGRGMVRVI